MYLDMNTGLLTAIESPIEKPCISKCSRCAISYTIASVLLIPVALVTRNNLSCTVQCFTATDLSMSGLPVRVFEADFIGFYIAMMCQFQKLERQTYLPNFATSLFTV